MSRFVRGEKTKNKLHDAIANDTVPVKPVKRGRERPRKEKKEEQKPKRKRGRPSKAQKLKEQLNMDNANSSNYLE